MSLSKPTMSAIRFGYGIRLGEEPPTGPDDLLAQVKAGRTEKLRFPVEGIEARYATIETMNRKFAAAQDKDRAKRRRAQRPLRRDMQHFYAMDTHARVIQSVYSSNPFNERLAFFWTDHFAVSALKQRQMRLLVPLYEAEALRPNIGGTFSELLRAAILHPAMLIYLDQVRSSGPNSQRGRKNKGLNENLGRELLELHTLGVDGGYAQKDVRDAALILTGMTVDRNTNQATFRHQLAEPGPLTFMGKTYGSQRRRIEDIEALLDDLAAMPQTRKHVCRKLAVHFVADNPPTPLVDAMTAAWESSGGNLMTVYAAMLSHPVAWDNPGEKARQPFDYIVAGLRALDVPERALSMPDRDAAAEDDGSPVVVPGKRATQMTTSMDSMQANVMVDPEEAADEKADREEQRKMGRKGGLKPPLNPLSVRTIRDLGQPIWEPSSPAGTAEAFAVWVSSGQLTGRIEWAQRLAGTEGKRIDPNRLLKDVLREAAREDTIRIVSQAPNRIAGMALVLASPEFNRR